MPLLRGQPVALALIGMLLIVWMVWPILYAKFIGWWTGKGFGFYWP
jgi:hypothetical protein